MTKIYKLTPKLIEKLTSYGLTNEAVCNILDISHEEFIALMEDESYSKAVRTGKDRADFNIIEQLYQKAIGYEHTDYHFYSFQGELIEHKYVKRYPPDLPSIIFWLKNRRPNEWKEKVESDGKLDEVTLQKLREIAYERMKAKL